MLSGIDATHVGHALAHGGEGFLHCISPDRVTGAAGASAVAVAEHEEVAELVLLFADSREE